jgi:hypothetical protein
LKGLPAAPTSLSLLFFLFDNLCISCLAYLFVISLSKISSNSGIAKPVNDLKSSGFFDNLSYESNESTTNWRKLDHIAVYTNYARDLISIETYHIC